MSIFKRTKLELQHPVEPPKQVGRLAIIVGHSASDGGANGSFPVGRLQEYKFHRQEIVPVMEARAKELGLESKVFLRDGTDIGGVGAMVSAWADQKTVAIELHFNSTSGASGSETLYDTAPAANIIFAQLVQDAMVRVLSRTGKANRGIKQTNTGRGSHNLTSVKCVGCLVEPAFCDNPGEAKLLWDNRVAYAKALVEAARAYLDKAFPA
jgi:N-acetylmuramoyl-L-alanine amidase